MITLVVGENEFGCKARLGVLLKGKQHKTYDLSEAESLEELSQDIRGESLFGENNTILIRYLDAAKSLQDSFLGLLGDVPEATELIIYLVGVKPSSPLSKKLIDSSQKEFEENLLAPNKLLSWVQAIVKKRGGIISSADARKLVEWSGEEQLTLSNEINKLITYHKKITDENIKNVAVPSPRTTIFQMLDAMLSGNISSAIERLNDLKAQQYDSDYIMGMICWQANAMNVAMASRSGSGNIIKDSGISPFVIQKAGSVISNMNRTELLKLNEYIIDADMKMKNAPVNREQLILQLINRIAFIRSS